MGFRSISRKWYLTEEEIRKEVRILADSKLKECYHYWEEVSETEKKKDVFTIGGWCKVSVHIYKCKFCGKVKED